MPDEFQFFLANGDTVRDAVVAWTAATGSGEIHGRKPACPHAMRMYKR